MPRPHDRRRPSARALARGSVPGAALLAAVAGLAAPVAAPAAAPAAAATPAAAAQSAPRPPTAGGIPQILAAAARPAYTPRDRTLFIEALQLDPEQTVRLDELLAAYDAAFTERLEAFRAAVREARPDPRGTAERYRAEQAAMRERMKTILAEAREAAAAAEAAGDRDEARRIMRAAEDELTALREDLGERLREFGPGAGAGRDLVDAMLERMRELAADFAAEREQLGDDLLEGARAMLDAEQAARWPALERRLVRRTLALGRLAGEQVDLVALLERTVPSAEIRALAAEPIARWERDVHASLILRNAELPRLEADLRALASRAAEDPDAAAALRGPAARRVQLHRAVRDATLAAAVAIADALPREPSAAFTEAFHRAAFPSVARSTPVEGLLAEARGRSDLAPSEARALAEIAERYAEQRSGVDDGIRLAIIEEEPRRLREAILAPPTIGTPAEPSAVTAAFRARRELGARIADAVRAVLGEERFAELRSSRPWRR